jgi:hypothetical protein
LKRKEEQKPKTQVPKKGHSQFLLNPPQERDVIYVLSVERPLVIAPTLLNTGEHTLGRSLMCAPSVGRLSATAQTLLFITERTWWTDPMTVSVGKPLGRAQTSLNIRECTLRRHPISVKIAGRLSVEKAALSDTIASILGRSPISVMSVGRALVSTQVSAHISASIQEKSPINVRSVGKPSTTAQISINIIESIPGKSPTGAISVEKASVASQIFPNTRESTLGREKCCNWQVTFFSWVCKLREKPYYAVTTRDRFCSTQSQGIPWGVRGPQGIRGTPHWVASGSQSSPYFRLQ